jgi:hypothetical protein
MASKDLLFLGLPTTLAKACAQRAVDVSGDEERHAGLMRWHPWKEKEETSMPVRNRIELTRVPRILPFSPDLQRAIPSVCSCNSTPPNLQRIQADVLVEQNTCGLVSRYINEPT